MNTSAKFECRWIYLETEESNCIFTQGLKPRIYLPVAHAEGRFIAPQPILDQIEANGQVVFRYVSTNGDAPRNIPIIRMAPIITSLESVILPAEFLA